MISSDQFLNFEEFQIHQKGSRLRNKLKIGNRFEIWAEFLPIVSIQNQNYTLENSSG